MSYVYNIESKEYVKEIIKHQIENKKKTLKINYYYFLLRIIKCSSKHYSLFVRFIHKENSEEKFMKDSYYNYKCYKADFITFFDSMKEFNVNV